MIVPPLLSGEWRSEMRVIEEVALAEVLIESTDKNNIWAIFDIERLEKIHKTLKEAEAIILDVPPAIYTRTFILRLQRDLAIIRMRTNALEARIDQLKGRSELRSMGDWKNFSQAEVLVKQTYRVDLMSITNMQALVNMLESLDEADEIIGNFEPTNLPESWKKRLRILSARSKMRRDMIIARIDEISRWFNGDARSELRNEPKEIIIFERFENYKLFKQQA